MKRKRYSDSFKAEAVKLVKEQGRSLTQAAKELGISASGLGRWIEKDDVENGRREGLTASEKAEIRELKRENKILRMERDILKKATAFVCHDGARW
jgi:transposase